MSQFSCPHFTSQAFYIINENGVRSCTEFPHYPLLALIRKQKFIGNGNLIKKYVNKVWDIKKIGNVAI